MKISLQLSNLVYVSSYFEACVAAGELEVAAEFNAKDNNAAGSVDFVILMDKFAISILEVRERYCGLHLA